MTIEKKDIAIGVLAMLLMTTTLVSISLAGALRWQQGQCVTQPEAERLITSATRITDMADFCLRTRMPIEQDFDADAALMARNDHAVAEIAQPTRHKN